MIRNPIDAVVAFINLPVMGEVLHLLARSGEIDNFIVSLPLDWLFDKGDGGSYIRTVATYLAEEARRHTSGMPLVVVWRQYQPSPAIRKWATVVEDILLSAGVPVYEGLPRAVSALAKLAAYSAYRKANP
jgi:hypothetical protein